MDQFEKALLCKTFTPLRQELFEKGKKAEVGEVREWRGQKMRKTSNGWVPAGEGKQKSNQEEPSTELKEQPKDLATLARAASDSALKAAAQSANEEVRIAAKKELERGKTEGSDAFEAPKSEGPGEGSTELNKDTSEKQTSKIGSEKSEVKPSFDEEKKRLLKELTDTNTRCSEELADILSPECSEEVEISMMDGSADVYIGGSNSHFNISYNSKDEDIEFNIRSSRTKAGSSDAALMVLVGKLLSNSILREMIQKPIVKYHEATDKYYDKLVELENSK